MKRFAIQDLKRVKEDFKKNDFPWEVIFLLQHNKNLFQSIN